jgi:hypothetical protein
MKRPAVARSRLLSMGMKREEKLAARPDETSYLRLLEIDSWDALMPSPARPSLRVDYCLKTG